MNIQRKNSAHHFRMQSEREQTLVTDASKKLSSVHQLRSNGRLTSGPRSLRLT